MFVFQYRNGVPLLLVDGDIDVSNVGDFEAAVRKLEGLNKSGALICLEQSAFMCVHAFSIVLSRASSAASRGRRLVVISPERSFHRKILRLLRFPFEIAQSVDQALVMLRRPGGPIAQT